MALRVLEDWLARLIDPDGDAGDVFLEPHDEPALIDAGSVSWRVFKNPLSVYVGGIAAVLLQLAEPRVGSGVWQYTSFRERPMERLRRTAHAAMLTVYGPRSRAEAMIASVSRMHSRVRGTARDGRAFRADDPELLEWVHATACFGFLEAYRHYVRPLALDERDAFYAESAPIARLYGAMSAPETEAAVAALFERMGGQLQRSDVVLEFLAIVRRMPLLPAALRPAQAVLTAAAIGLLPAPLRERIGLDGRRLPRWQRRLVCTTGRVADRIMLRSHPAVQACRRLGLRPDFLSARKVDAVEGQVSTALSPAERNSSATRAGRCRRSRRSRPERPRRRARPPRSATRTPRGR
ncbi:MAG TPA: oxygenase MpaB family protein [Caldimonas sp.]|nr:oxygenase MpaB family protein [Caldimonas sp.]